jgi:hypothetical protein
MSGRVACRVELHVGSSCMSGRVACRVGLHVGSSCMSDHNRATPVVACVESVPNGERLGSGLTVPDRQSMNGIGHARLVGVDTGWLPCRWLTTTTSRYPDSRVTPHSLITRNGG